MKYFHSLLFLLFTLSGFTQNLQLHYDFRHSIDPGLNPKNFPSFSFEYFKNLDTLNTGSFLIKLQTDLNGTNGNAGQVFTQISQNLRFWSIRIFLNLNYSGGLGITPDYYGYFIAGSYGIGISCPYQWKGAWFAVNAIFRFTAFSKPSYDPQFTFYFGKGWFNYRINADGSFVFWTQNKNQGNEYTKSLHGKKFAFFGDPKIWIRVKGGFYLGSKINVFYNLLGKENQIQFYPTLGTKYQF
jgi:hypothetical protein